MGETVLNQKQAIAHLLKDRENCASNVKSEADTIREGKTRLLDQIKIMKKWNSDITGELSNMVDNHALAEEVIIKLDTIALENIKATEEMRKKNEKAMIENSGL